MYRKCIVYTATEVRAGKTANVASPNANFASLDVWSRCVSLEWCARKFIAFVEFKISHLCIQSICRKKANEIGVF